MNFDALYDAVEVDFGKRIALGVCMATSVHLTTKIKPKDITEEGRYLKRIQKKIKRLLWEYAPDEIDLILKLENCTHDWTLCNTLNGLGGCERKTFKQLITMSEDLVC